jgi:hypothetical protein
VGVKFKGKVQPRTGHEGTEGENWYSSILPLTSEPDGMGGQRLVSAASPPAKTWYPFTGGWVSPGTRVRKNRVTTQTRSPDNATYSE